MTEELIVDTAAAPATPAPTDVRQPLVETLPADNPEPKQFAIPDAYKDKPWASKVKTEDDLWKQLENTQSLIGKKAIIPDFEKATPAEVEDYYKQSRPADKSAYVFDEETPAEMKEIYSDLLYKNGISGHQGNEIIKQFREMEKKQMDKLTDPQAFKSIVMQKLGTQVESETAKALIIEYLGREEMERVHAHLTNDALAAMYVLASKLRESHGVKEGDKAAGKTHAAINVDERETELLKEIFTIPSSDFITKNKVLAELQALQNKKYGGK